MHRSSSSRPTSATTTTVLRIAASSARSFKESDPLGGHDPYSASKAAAEIVVASYRDSYLRAWHRGGGRVGARGQRHRRRRLGRGPHRALTRSARSGCGQADPRAQSTTSRGRGSTCSSRSAGICSLGAKLEQARGRSQSAEADRPLRASLQLRPRSPSANRRVRESRRGNPEATGPARGSKSTRKSTSRKRRSSVSPSTRRKTSSAGSRAGIFLAPSLKPSRGIARIPARAG